MGLFLLVTLGPLLLIAHFLSLKDSDTRWLLLLAGAFLAVCGTSPKLDNTALGWWCDLFAGTYIYFGAMSFFHHR